MCTPLIPHCLWCQLLSQPCQIGSKFHVLGTSLPRFRPYISSLSRILWTGAERPLLGLVVLFALCSCLVKPRRTFLPMLWKMSCVMVASNPVCFQRSSFLTQGREGGLQWDSWYILKYLLKRLTEAGVIRCVNELGLFQCSKWHTHFPMVLHRNPLNSMYFFSSAKVVSSEGVL